ncbi:MAG TPA: C-type lectin domain-containing protein [Kofleriaceae bacterium]|nr:C-type lectin domain-containing protein [Kofleriaceae bacterium]
MDRSASTLALGVALALTGCAQLLGLESPGLGDAGAPGDGARPGDGLMDGIVDGGTDAPITSNACPTSYQSVPSVGIYRFVTTTAPWPVAAQDCANDGVPNSSKHTHLAVVTSTMEYSALASMVMADNWIGLSDRATEGNLIWVTAESTSYPPMSGSPWGIGEPNNSAAVDCVRLEVSGLFSMLDCANTRRYICECDTFADDPTRY